MPIRTFIRSFFLTLHINISQKAILNELVSHTLVYKHMRILHIAFLQLGPHTRHFSQFNDNSTDWCCESRYAFVIRVWQFVHEQRTHTRTLIVLMPHTCSLPHTRHFSQLRQFINRLMLRKYVRICDLSSAVCALDAVNNALSSNEGAHSSSFESN